MTTIAIVLIVFLSLTTLMFLLAAYKLSAKLTQTETELDRVETLLDEIRNDPDYWIIDRPYGR